MKSQTQHIGNYSNVFDYSPFGAPLDGRMIENIFHQEEITDTSTVVKTIYVLEETFDVASDWQDVASYSQISYPSGKMEVKNPSSFMRLIGAKKGFTTGTGQHAVSFEIASLPAGMSLCQAPGGVIMGAQYNKTSDTLVGTGSYQIQSVSRHYVVVEIRNENNALVLKDSTNSTGTYSYAFSAPQGKEYTVSFHNKSMCSNLGFQIDNVFISYDTLEIVTGNTIVVTDTLFIINNDFENAVIEPNGAGVKIDGWTHYSPSTTLSVEPHNGSDWLKVVSTNGTHGAHQAFAVEPGETYTFEIDLHRPAGMNNVINVVIWKNTGPSGAYTLHVLNTDGSNTFNYTATSSNIYIQIRQAGTYYLDNIRMYRTYEDTMFVSGYEVDRAYRYGYNTQERVPEIQKDHYTAPYWEYDPRVVHRWNRDPMAFKYPWQSPYVINNNNPIWFHDPFGLEGEEPKENELGDKKIGIDDNGNVIEYTFTYIKDKKDGYVKGWKGKINEELTQRMNANAVDVIGYRDYRTSGDLPSLEDGILTPDNAYQEANTKDMLSLTISVLAEFKGIPLVGEIISIASMDPNAPNPIGVLPLPDLSDKWDNEIQEFGKRGASKSWNLMVNYARKYNTDDNTSVIFVYAAQDIHQNLERKFPTAIVYKNAKEAEAALGFKPRVVYYKFIDNKTKNLIVPVQNKLFIP